MIDILSFLKKSSSPAKAVHQIRTDFIRRQSKVNSYPGPSIVPDAIKLFKQVISQKISIIITGYW